MAETRDRAVTEFAAEGAETVARSFGVVGDAVGGLMRDLGQLAAIAAPITAALASIGGAITAHKIAEVGAAYENVQARMAGTLTALGFASDFTEGLEEGASAMDSIYAAAAKLPGEAEDYIEVFTQGLTVLSSGIKGGLSDIADFSNKYTAVAKSLQIDSMQAANDLQRMLAPGRGMAGIETKTFTRLLPYMKQIQGQAAITAQSFNAMTDVERTEILGKALTMLDPMVAKMATSWDAVSGAVKTAERNLIRIGTAPLFAQMKVSLQTVADLILDSSGKLHGFGLVVARIGEGISGHLAKGLEQVTSRIVAMTEAFRGWLDGAENSPFLRRLERIFAAGQRMAETTGFGGERSTTGAVAGTMTGMAGMAMLSRMLPGGALVQMLVGPIAAAAGAALGPAIGGIFTASGLDTQIDKLIGWFGGLEGPLLAIGDAALGAITGFLGAFDTEDVELWLRLMGDAFKDIINAIGPLISVLSDMLGPALAGLTKMVGITLLGVLQLFADSMTALVVVLKDAARAINSDYGGTVQGQRGLFGDPNVSAEYRAVPDDGKLSAMLAGKDQGPGAFTKWLASLSASLTAAEGASKGGKHKAPPQRQPPVVQDFRGSRFTIQQDFDKNFDPDRIAVAFAKDVERIGTKRLQSGLEPLFGAS